MPSADVSVTRLKFYLLKPAYTGARFVMDAYTAWAGAAVLSHGDHAQAYP